MVSGCVIGASLDFSEDLGVAPVTGDLYVIKVKDLAGQLSEVKMAVLHETSKNLVTHKMLFYEPESLIDRS
jgi:hypothetical protein